TGDDDFAFAEGNGLGGQSNGFQSRATHLVDGHRSDLGIAAALQSGLARGILSQPRLNDVAENCFVHLFGFDAGAANRFRDDFCAQFRGGKSGQAALKFADGSANRGENYGGFHGSSSGGATETSITPEEIRHKNEEDGAAPSSLRCRNCDGGKVAG